MVPDVVRAKQFELIDDIGNKRATLGIDMDGATQIVLYDAKGIVTWAAGGLPLRRSDEADTSFTRKSPPGAKAAAHYKYLVVQSDVTESSIHDHLIQMPVETPPSSSTILPLSTATVFHIGSIPGTSASSNS